jgi:hypothetical protein
MVSPKIGQQVLDIITSGMYDNPLMIYREYIQNAVDSIEEAINEHLLDNATAKIVINITGSTRTVTILDNGTGVSNLNVPIILTSIGSSPKENGDSIGFRGIGRLGGLGYCEKLIFETKSTVDDKVAILTWDRKKIDNTIKECDDSLSLLEAIKRITQLEFRDVSDEDLPHFFKVTLLNIQRFHADKLISNKTIYDYLSQNAPVPFDNNVFSFSEQINTGSFLFRGNRNYNIELNGSQVFRPYTDEIIINGKVIDKLESIVEFNFKDENEKPLAFGWYAVTNFKSAFPINLGMKGIRIRQDNIQIGDTRLFEEFYKEKRFAGWHIGEIYVLNNGLKPNARRDGFEQSPQYERFIENSIILTKHLTTLCRKASIKRNNIARADKKLKQIESQLQMLHTIHDAEQLKLFVTNSINIINNIQSQYQEFNTEFHFIEIEDLKSKLNNIDQIKENKWSAIIKNMGIKSYRIKPLLTTITKVINQSYDECKSSDDLIHKILEKVQKDN